MADDFSKSLGVNVKANFDSSGFEKGSDRVIASAERQATALQALRKSTSELQQLQSAYSKTPEIYASERERYRQEHGGHGASIFNKEAEKYELSRLEFQIKSGGGTLPGIPQKSQEDFEPRDISTKRLGQLVEDKFSQFGGMSKTQRKALMGDVQYDVQKLQGRYSAIQKYYKEKIYETTAAFEGLSGEDQLKGMEKYNSELQRYGDYVTKAQKASDELTKSTKNFTEQAGLASKSLPAYAASVINMGVTIGQGIAQISRAGALAFDYSSPMAMYSAQQQFQIQKSKTMWSMGGSTIGQIAGFAMGGFPGSYIGGMIGGGAGDIISTFLNIEPEKQLKFMGQMYGKSGEMAGRFPGVQGAEYELARRTGASQEQIQALLKRYGTGKDNLGIDQTAMATLANQYISSTGRINDKGIDEWMQLYARTNVMPTGAGQYEKFIGQGGVGMMSRAAGRMGIGEQNKARLADVNQYFQQATNMAGRLFTGRGDIERATSMTLNLPFDLFGKDITNPNVKNWATSFEGMQQVQQGFQALGQPQGTGQDAFLFNALNKGGNWRETLLRIQEGIYGKGNIQDILGYAKTAYGGRAGDAVFAMLQGKGVSPDVQRYLSKAMDSETGYSGLMQRINESTKGNGFKSAEDLQAFMDKQFGKKTVSPLAQTISGESISVTESARGMAEAFTAGLARFNIEVAKVAASPETQKKVQGIMDDTIESVRSAFGVAGNKPTTPQEQAAKVEYQKEHKGESTIESSFWDWFKKQRDDSHREKYLESPHGSNGTWESDSTQAIKTSDGKTLNLNVHTTITAGNTVPQSNNMSMSPHQR